MVHFEVIQPGRDAISNGGMDVDSIFHVINVNENVAVLWGTLLGKLSFFIQRLELQRLVHSHQYK